MPLEPGSLTDARDDVIASTAVAMERLIEVISMTTSRETILAAQLSAAQGRLITSIVRFSAERDGKR